MDLVQSLTHLTPGAHRCATTHDAHQALEPHRLQARWVAKGSSLWPVQDQSKIMAEKAEKQPCLATLFIPFLYPMMGSDRNSKELWHDIGLSPRYITFLSQVGWESAGFHMFPPFSVGTALCQVCCKERYPWEGALGKLWRVWRVATGS